MMEENGLPKGWVETTLGEVTLKKQYGYTESAKFEVVGPRFLRITDIQNDFISWNTVPYCPISELDYKKYKLNIGDIVIARTGNSTGATATIKENIDAVFASYLIRFQLDENIAYFKFIDFLLRSRYWDVFVKSVKSGSAQGGANANDFALFPIKLPTLPEQQSIASILTSFDDKIELLQAQNETLETIAQTIFKEWFGKYQVGDELPEGWRVGKLKEFIVESIGGDYGKEVAIGDFTEETVCLRGTDLPDMKMGVPQKAPIRFLKKSKLKNCKLINGDIVIEISGGTENQSTGRVAYINEEILNNSKFPMTCVNFCRILRPKNVENSYFIYSLFEYLYNRKVLFNWENGTTGIKNLNLKALLNVFNLVLPISDHKISEFNKYAKSSFIKIQSNNSQIQTLQATRDTLLPKLMSGQLRVTEFQEQLCEVM